MNTGESERKSKPSRQLQKLDKTPSENRIFTSKTWFFSKYPILNKHYKWVNAARYTDLLITRH